MLKKLNALFSSGFGKSHPENAQNASKDNLTNKVAFIVDAYENQKSGGVISANRFIQILKKEYDLTVVSTFNESQKGEEKILGFYFPFTKNIMKKNGFTFGYPDKNKLKRVCDKVELVYIHFPFLLGIKAIKIAKKMGKPVVVGFHLQPENVLMNMGLKSKKIIDFMYKLFIRKFYNLADMVICPSPFAEKLLHSSPYFKGKTMVISNGLIPEFTPNPDKKIQDYQDKFVILTVGRLAKEKRHDVIIDAIKQSKYKNKIKLIITGDGVLKNRLLKIGKELPVQPKIGFVSKEELTQLYNTADLYVQASEVELEGMSVLEAIGCGCPAIISDSNNSASKQFALNEDFLFSNGNSQKLAKKIDYWFENQAKLKDAGKQYAESAKQYYIENSGKKMTALFKETINNNAENIDG
jgi:glycosyltransferase involved in cell wall biosynthesis